MDILGMGPAEIFLILVIALIVFGPGKLPEIGAAVGRAIGDFRRASRDLTAGLQGSVGDIRGSIEGTINDTKAEIQGATDSIRQEAQALSQEITAQPARQASPQKAADDDLDANWLRLGMYVEGDGGA